MTDYKGTPKSVERAKLVELHYPCVGEHTEEFPDAIRIDLSATRAADSILVTYDFDRDGYVISMPTVHAWEMDDEEMDEGWRELAFIPAWIKGCGDD